MTEKISLIIVTRNREKKLNKCLKSLASQTILPNEVIVVDNMSSDNTKKVVLSYKKNLPIVYVLEKKIGIPYARNRGINEAKGSILLMLDDDCEADKYWVERMVESHKKYPKAWAIQGRTFSLPEKQLYSLISDFKRFISIKRFSKNKLPLTEMKNFLFNDFKDELEFFTCDTRNFAIKSSCLKKHKLEFDTNFYYGEDMDFGRQIVEGNGLIIFYPPAQVAHWERSTLLEFLKQRWRFGKATAKIADKWKSPSLISNVKFMSSPDILIAFVLFCSESNQWRNLPKLLAILLLDRISHFSGYFFERLIRLTEKLQ